MKGRPDLPAFDLLMIDSATVLDTKQIPGGKPIVLIYFSPDCDHCQKLTSSILSDMQDMKDIRFYFITVDPFARLKVFNKYYKIYKYPNIVLGRDYNFFYPKFINTFNTPHIALYDGDKKLRVVFVGGTDAHRLVNEIDNL